MDQGRVQVERSHIVEAGVEATCWHFNPWRILKVMTETAGPFGTMPQEPWFPGKGAKLDHGVQINCRKVHTHASYKITTTWENFNNRRTKMIFLSDELWLISNKSVSFVNGTKSVVRHNLGLCRHFNTTQVFSCEYSKISRNSFNIEHLWWLLLDSNQIVATQILTKAKRSYVYILIIATQTKIWFFSYTVNINKNLKKTDEKKLF